MVLGVGANLTVAEFPPGVRGASLHALTAPQPPPDADDVLAALLQALGRRLGRLEAGGLAAQLDEWRQRAAGLGAAVTATTPGGPVAGVAVDIDAEGALLIDTADRGRVRLVAGDIHLDAPGERPPGVSRR